MTRFGKAVVSKDARQGKDPTKGSRGRNTPGARMVGKPPPAGHQSPEHPLDRAERLRRIAGGGKR